MEVIKQESNLYKYASIDDVNSVLKNLMLKAKEASKNAYSPYSKFNVGCALLLANDEIILGNNQENIAFPSGLCAERTAIFYAGANFPTVPIKAMAVTAFSDNYEVNNPVMPCGACLQSISEYELRFENKIELILQGNSGPVFVANGIKTFLPFQFFLKELSL
jgi:cytidine deaminase